MTAMFADDGPAEDDARKPGMVSAFIETEPGIHKPLEECSREEIQSRIISLTMQAEALIDEADALTRYLDG